MLCAAVAAVSDKLRAILLNKIHKILRFLSHFVNSAQDGQFCAHRATLCKILCAQNHRILTLYSYMAVINIGLISCLVLTVRYTFCKLLN